MVTERFFRITLQFIVYTSFVLVNAGYAVPNNAFAEENAVYSTWEFQLSEKSKLVWYYFTKQDFNKNQPNKVLINDKQFVMRPDVRPPVINTLYLLEYLEIKEGETVLDVGTGSGIHAIFAADKASHIVATDIYKPAIENAINNARLHGVGDKIDFRVGDLFKPVGDDEKFDVILLNINFPFAVGNDRQRLHERFFAEVGKYMKQNTRIYFQTSFIKNMPYITDLMNRNGFRIMQMHMQYIPKQKHEPLLLVIQKAEED